VSLESHLTRQIEHSGEFFWHVLRRDVVFERLPVDRAFGVIDIGAGAGLLGESLRVARPNARYRFVEPIPALERHLEERFGSEANAGRDGTYAGAEFLMLMDVLEHQPNDRSLLGDIVAKMDRGAMLFITVPALGALWSKWDEELGHYRRYTRASLSALLREFPLDVVEVSYLFPELVPAALVRKVIRRTAAAGTSAGATEFPDLQPRLNNVLYGIGSLTMKVRRWMPFGSSVLAVAVRR
jgi:hypothetical protein